MTTWTPYTDLRLLHGASAGVSPEHMAAVFDTTVDGIADRLRFLCGGEPDETSLTAAIAERSMPRPDLAASEAASEARENRTSHRGGGRDSCASPRDVALDGAWSPDFSPVAGSGAQDAPERRPGGNAPQGPAQGLCGDAPVLAQFAPQARGSVAIADRVTAAGAATGCECPTCNWHRRAAAALASIHAIAPVLAGVLVMVSASRDEADARDDVHVIPFGRDGMLADVLLSVAETLTDAEIADGDDDEEAEADAPMVH